MLRVSSFLKVNKTSDKPEIFSALRVPWLWITNSLATGGSSSIRVCIEYLTTAQFAKEAGLPGWFHLSRWMCTDFGSKLRLSVGFTGRIELVVNWNETAVYVLGLYLGFVPTRSFQLAFFTPRIECSALGFSYVVNLEMYNSLKWVLLRSAGKKNASSAFRLG